MTSKTLLKARTIYKAGGVERVTPTCYHVTSTSGETYAVETTLARCSCPTPKGTLCSHYAAVIITRAKRRAAASRARAVA